ncbi:GGDEF domain-containing protein [uncultured Novosphingobium sp.]|uniref:GGDEF domain-containing protein n=1 Tax=uncultured Novosphingobium sp. TaxID=292277 RepID=UPI00258905F6|nr:GGDEF domain-containing protein [uncultured Novosphingobium sp.]
MAQVRSLFSSVTPSSVMAAIFLLNVWIAFEKTQGVAFLMIGLLGTALNGWRIAMAMLLRDKAFAPLVSRQEAARLEARFALPYIGFALVMSVFCGLVFRASQPELHMITVCLAVGYCAGVAANCGLRPRLAITSIVLAMAPIIVFSLLKEEATYAAMAIVILALIGGAVRSMIVRYDESQTEIAARISSVSMARSDVLTSLPNRLALREFFTARIAQSAPGTQMAVHYLDLDGFKPVNDRYGHAAGDQVLLAVAGRLRNTVRHTDMVARLGGDEFAIVQLGITNEEEAHGLAWRVRDVIQQPFQIDSFSISLTTSIGTVLNFDQGASLDALLRLADAQLYGVKRARQRVLLGVPA